MVSRIGGAAIPCPWRWLIMACLLPRSVKKIAGHVLPVAKIFGFAPENGRHLRMYAHFSSLRNWKIQPPGDGSLLAAFTPCGKWTSTARGIFGSGGRHSFVLIVVLTIDGNLEVIDRKAFARQVARRHSTLIASLRIAEWIG